MKPAGSTFNYGRDTLFLDARRAAPLLPCSPEPAGSVPNATPEAQRQSMAAILCDLHDAWAVVTMDTATRC